MAGVILYGQKGGTPSYVPQYSGQGKITLLSDDGSSGYAEFTSSGVLTWKGNRVPGNVDIFCVGGGAGGCYGKTVQGAEYAGGGGGGGYTATAKNQTLPKETAVTIGAGGAAAAAGGTTSVALEGVTINAPGGQPGSMEGTAYSNFSGGNGGSGGGDGGRGYNNSVSSSINGSKGGTDGGNGEKTVSGGTGKVGVGQGTTTKDLLGRIHAGGGAGASGWYSSGYAPSSAGGASDFEGGKGANGSYYSTTGTTDHAHGGGGGGGYGGGGGGAMGTTKGAAPGVGGQGFAMIAWGNYYSILGLDGSAQQEVS